MEILNATSNGISIDYFQAQKGQAWVMIGSNRSGIDEFADLLCGAPQKVSADRFDLPAKAARVSFKQQQELFEAELKKDETDLIDRIDPGTPARAFIRNVEKNEALIRIFSMWEHLDKGYRFLSTGQARKLMILSQLTRRPGTLYIQSPFDGLDRDARINLDKALSGLCSSQILILLFINNMSDVPDWCTHAAFFSGGKIAIQGEKPLVMETIREQFETEGVAFTGLGDKVYPGSLDQETTHNILVRLKNGRAGYNNKPVFSKLDLKIEKGEHTLISGPNGSGKSTLLHLITGDHPACYKNDLVIFGRKRGTGESIWDIKQKMGMVTPEIHRNYIVPGTALHCILSGLFDSIGLYQKYSQPQEQEARDWLERLKLSDKADTPFRSLGFAQQRLVLIARALIKMPLLLLLDEPTQGLDAKNRNALLDFLENLAQDNLSTIVYITHREDEFRPFFRQHVQMGTQGHRM